MNKILIVFFVLGFFILTSTYQQSFADDPDSDGLDTLIDNCALNYNPQQKDLDGDNIGDICDRDIDGDGFQNANDVCALESGPQTDSDTDGLPDVCDPDINNDGTYEKPFLKIIQSTNHSDLFITLASDPLGNSLTSNIYAFTNVDSGLSRGSEHERFSSIEAIPPLNLRVEFSDIELVFQDPNGGDTSTRTFTEVYSDKDSNGDFTIRLADSTVLATGTELVVNVITDVNPSSSEYLKATGFGSVKITGPSSSAFYNEIISHSPSGELKFIITQFDAVDDQGKFEADAFFYIPTNSCELNYHIVNGFCVPIVCPADEILVNGVCTSNEATITITKVVINDNGNTLTVDDFSPIIDDHWAVEFGTPITVQPGVHRISESGPLGYMRMYGEDCPTGQVIVDPGEHVICEIINNDLPYEMRQFLTVDKVVINDDGGSSTIDDFSYEIEGVLAGYYSVPEFGVPYEVQSSTFRVYEESTSGYTYTISGDCEPDGTITFERGDKLHCTITNDDIPPEEVSCTQNWLSTTATNHYREHTEFYKQLDAVYAGTIINSIYKNPVLAETQFMIFDMIAICPEFDFDIPEQFEDRCITGVGTTEVFRCPPLDCPIDGPGCFDPYQRLRITMEPTVVYSLGAWSQGTISDIQFIQQIQNSINSEQIKVKTYPISSSTIPYGIGVSFAVLFVVIGFAIYSAFRRN